ncbi:glycosyltransferase [Methylomonas sp. DH-1]|uniref:glycosyltransferase n=1 Tax=Methylomonas sp. (strain DH-1) TaxID=1727196 RepID=UPI0007C91423|nr:glycosyltransferase [Methylomonas sp. DH-1]ANE56383.1 hypothetical protein AYM39_15145 [Methylomonas sp. DH-1]
MKVLAVSYVLPPNLYSQAIQIGRLLYHARLPMAAVTGQVEALANGLDVYPDFDSRLLFRLPVAYRAPVSGLMHRIAANLLPLYARAPDEFLGWVPLAERAVVERLAQGDFAPDVLLTFGEPMSDHLLGLRLKRRYGLPWVAHFSDPWADNPFRRRFFLANIRNRQLEREVIANADRIIFTSQETVDLVMAKYPAAWRQKARVLPHGFEPDAYGDSPRDPDAPLLIRYLGNFYGHRSPQPLFEALAAILRERPDELHGVRIELVGGVPPRMLKSAAFRSLPDGLLKLVPTVDYSASLALMKQADLLLVIDAPDDLSVFLPGKLVDYLGAGVPIFGIVPPGASAQLISKLGGGVANPRRPAEIAESLTQALRNIRERRAAGTGPAWGNPEVRAAYSADAVAERFRSIVGELAGSGADE